MDPTSIIHQHQKLQLERSAARISRPASTVPNVPPPAYTPTATGVPDLATLLSRPLPPDFDLTADDEDEDEDEHEEDPSPISLTLNTAPRISGRDNIVLPNASPVADQVRFTTLLLAALQQLNAKAGTEIGGGQQLPVLSINLTINCGLTITGTGNVVCAPTVSLAQGLAMKRKAADAEIGVEQSVAKKLRE